MVNDLSIGHHDHIRKGVKHIRRGLQQRHHRGVADLIGHVLQRLDDVISGRSIKSVGDGVQKHDASGWHEHLSKRHAALLSTTHTADHSIADEHIGSFVQTQNLQGVLNLKGQIMDMWFINASSH